MGFVSHRFAFQSKYRAAHRRALADARDMARRNLGGAHGTMASSVTALEQGKMRGLVGSKHPGARAQEYGAFIRPKTAKVLKFADGGYAMSARIPAKHWLSRTGKQWRRLMRTRLREGK